MNQMMQPFLKLITLVIALLGLAAALIGVIGFVIFLSYSGIQLPNLTSEDKESSLPMAEISVVKALADPALMCG